MYGISTPSRICRATSALKEAVNASSRGRNLSPANLRYLRESQSLVLGGGGERMVEPDTTYSVMIAASVQPFNFR